MIDGHEHVLIVGSCGNSWEENRKYLKNYWMNREVFKNRYELCLSQLPVKGTLVNHKGISMEKQTEGLYLGLHNRSMLLLTKPSKNISKETSDLHKVDMLLITTNSGFPGAYHHRSVYPGKIVILGSMNRWMQRAWKEFADSRDIEIYSTCDSGALHEIF